MTQPIPSKVIEGICKAGIYWPSIDSLHMDLAESAMAWFTYLTSPAGRLFGYYNANMHVVISGIMSG